MQGFQLLGIAWREKHRARSARTHEWGLDPPIGPLQGQSQGFQLLGIVGGRNIEREAQEPTSGV